MHAAAQQAEGQAGHQARLRRHRARGGRAGGRVRLRHPGGPAAAPQLPCAGRLPPVCTAAMVSTGLMAMLLLQDKRHTLRSYAAYADWVKAVHFSHASEQVPSVPPHAASLPAAVAALVCRPLLLLWPRCLRAAGGRQMAGGSGSGPQQAERQAPQAAHVRGPGALGGPDRSGVLAHRGDPRRRVRVPLRPGGCCCRRPLLFSPSSSLCGAGRKAVSSLTAFSLGCVADSACIVLLSF